MSLLFSNHPTVQILTNKPTQHTSRSGIVIHPRTASPYTPQRKPTVNHPGDFHPSFLSPFSQKIKDKPDTKHFVAHHKNKKERIIPYLNKPFEPCPQSLAPYIGK